MTLVHYVLLLYYLIFALKILKEEDDTDTSNILSRLERHNKVKDDIEKVAANVKEIIVTVKIYRSNPRPQWRQVNHYWLAENRFSWDPVAIVLRQAYFSFFCWDLIGL